MSARFARLGSSPMPAGAGDDRRREHRFSARALAAIRSGRGECVGVPVIDVSAHGCAVQAEADWLRQGAFVAIELGDNPPLSAIVRWVRDGAAGMEFLAPIPLERREWHALLDDHFA